MQDIELAQCNVRRTQHYILQYPLFPAIDFLKGLMDRSSQKTQARQPSKRQEDDTTQHWISRVRGILQAIQTIQRGYGTPQRDQQENYRAIFASLSEWVNF